MTHHLIISQEFLPQDGGIAVIAYEIAKNLAQQGHQVTVLTWDYTHQKWPSQFSDASQAFELCRIKPQGNRWMQIGALYFAALGIQQRRKIDRVWATSWNFSGVAAALLKMTLSTPYLLMTQGYEVSPLALKCCDQSLLKYALRHAHRVFSISRFTQSLTQRWMAKGREVEFVPHGVDIERFHPTVDGQNVRRKLRAESRKVMLTVARLFPRKGHDRVIDALPKIIEKIPNVLYVIVGIGPNLNPLKKKVTDLKLDAYVHFAGFVQDQELPEYYAACDLFILPNREISDVKDPWAGDFEGFGVVFAEASAAGKPVIAGRSGGASDAVSHGVTGILVDPEGVQEIADQAIRILSDFDYARQLGHAGRRKTETELNWPSLIHRYEQCFKRS